MPSSLAVADRSKPVARFFAVTCAFGTAAPEASMTDPVTVPVKACCDQAVNDIEANSENTITTRFIAIVSFVGIPLAVSDRITPGPTDRNQEFVNSEYSVCQQSVCCTLTQASRSHILALSMRRG